MYFDITDKLTLNNYNALMNNTESLIEAPSNIA